MNTQEKAFDILKSLNENRQLLTSVYGLYQTKLQTLEMQKMQMFEIYELIMEKFDDLKSNQSKKISQTKLKLVKKDLDIKKNEFDDLYKAILCAFDDIEKLRVMYKKNILNATSNFKSLNSEDLDKNIKQSYLKQVSFIKKVLEAIKKLKEKYAKIVLEVESEMNEFTALFKKFDQVA